VLTRRRIGVCAVALAAVPCVSAVPAPAAAAPASVVIDGHGYGHGIGLSQWGAYGYAVDFGWSAAQILDHFYGGTVAATTTENTITVRLLVLDNQPQTAVVNDNGNLVVDGVAGGPWRSVVAREVAPGSYAVWARADATVCPSASDPMGAGWTQLSTGVGPSVVVRPNTDTSASTNMADLAAVCEPSGRVRSYRGLLRMVNAADGANRTVNEAPLEQYLRSVVASEVSWGWASAGGGRGAQALQAQAVAARSYALAENRAPWAKTCDLQYCQTYGGAAWRTSTTSGFTVVEKPAIDAAVTATAGVVRRIGSPQGAIAYTMFSSSSGGQTAPSTLGFTPVADAGDATTANPHHSWTATVNGSTLEAAYPSIGSFAAVSVLARDGAGEWGGRATSVEVRGSAGAVTVTGDQFRRAAGLKSTWFNVRGVSNDGCAGRSAPPLGSPADAAAPAGYTPLTPTRLADTRNGTGVPAGRVPGGCTLVIATGQVGASGVAINVTAINPVATGFLTAYACGQPMPLASVLQPLGGTTVGGSSMVPVDAEGRVCLYSRVTTDVVVDLFGRYDPTAGTRYEPIVPARLLDTRTARPTAAGSVTRVRIAGSASVPSGATAATVVVHAMNPVGRGYASLYDCSAAPPFVSSINAMPGLSLANHGHVPLAGSGELCVYTSTSMHVAIDVSGWFGSTATTRYIALTPARAADTREALGLPARMAAGTTGQLRIAGVAGLPAAGALRSVAAEVIAVAPAAAGFLTVHPCGTSNPTVSMNRYITGGSTAALVTQQVSAAGDWCIATSAATDVVVDVSGYFATT
jgi:SpoIID/LytB domain protein